MAHRRVPLEESIVGRKQEMKQDDLMKGLSPFIGHEAERDFLIQLLAEVEQLARGDQTPPLVQAVFVRGEAGIGKTRLVYEMSNEAQQRGWVVLSSRSVPQESSFVYGCWTNIMKQASSWVVSPNLIDPVMQAGVTDRGELFYWEFLCQIIFQVCKKHPLLVALDDLHWADTSSCAFLRYVVQRLKNWPCLLVGTYRKYDLDVNHILRSVLNDMQHDQTATILPLSPLNIHQIRTFISSIPDLPPISSIRLEQIIFSAAGNPCFAEALARSHVSLLPKVIATILASRFNTLSPSCQHLLSDAAIVGESIDLQMIMSVETIEHTSMDVNEETVFDALEEAQRRGILVGGGIWTTYQIPLQTSVMDHLSIRTCFSRSASTGAPPCYNDQTNTLTFSRFCGTGKS